MTDDNTAQYSDPIAQPEGSSRNFGDVEKLCNDLTHWSHNYSINNPMQSVAIFNETITMLRSLAAELAELKSHFNGINHIDSYGRGARAQHEKDQAEIAALRAEKAKLEETHERNHRIFVKFKIESEAEIAALRATIEELK